MSLVYMLSRVSQLGLTLRPVLVCLALWLAVPGDLLWFRQQTVALRIASEQRAWKHCLSRFPRLAGPNAVVHWPSSAPIEVRLRSADIPVYVIAYNNPTFVANMVSQIDCYGSKAIVVDNGSTFPPMLKLLETIRSWRSRMGALHEVRNLSQNTGPRGAAFAPEIVSEMPAFAAITDADIAFNPHLPPNFLEVLAAVAEWNPGRKVGFALNISSPSRFWPGLYGDGKTLVEFESMWWLKPIPDVTGNGLELYDASIDTTFAVYNVRAMISQCNQRSCHGFAGLRVAGIFTAEHQPWTVNFTSGWEQAEIEAAFGSSSQGSTISNKLREFGILRGFQGDTRVR